MTPSHNCGTGSVLGLGMGCVCENVVLLAVGRWFPSDTPDTQMKVTFHHHRHRYTFYCSIPHIISTGVMPYLFGCFAVV